ncbi:MAG: PqqD family protein [Planctomycetes bacterium]|nr:PqqD family protein [Planctomycetota bacterium]
MKTAEDVTYQEVGDEVVVLDLKSGRYFGLNRTAGFIWIGLVDPRESKSSPDDYAKTFGVSPRNTANRQKHPGHRRRDRTKAQVHGPETRIHGTAAGRH